MATTIEIPAPLNLDAGMVEDPSPSPVSPQGILATTPMGKRTPRMTERGSPLRVSFGESHSIVVIAPRASYNPAEGPCLPISGRENQRRLCETAARHSEVCGAHRSQQQHPRQLARSSSSNARASHHTIIKRSCMIVRALSAPFTLIACVAQYPTTANDSFELLM